MKIAIVNTYYYPQDVGGAERSIQFMAEAFVQQGHQVMVVVTGEADTQENIRGVTVVRRRRRNSAQTIKAPNPVKKLAWHAVDSWNKNAAKDAAKIIIEFSPDVVHTNNLSGFSVALWPLLKQAGLTIVHTLRDYYLLCPNTAMFKNGKSCSDKRCSACRVLSIPRLAATQYVDHVVGNSHYILERHLKDGAFSNATSNVIYNAYKAPGVVSPRDQLGRDGVIVFGYIGRLAQTKGVELLIDTFGRLSAERPGVAIRLLIAGKGDAAYEDELRSRSQGKGDIRFLGHVKPEEFYEQVDYPVVPSLWHEPLARVLFESFAHGLPVIASNTGGSPELVVSGKTGLIFDPSVFDSLFATMHKAMVQKNEYKLLSIEVFGMSEKFSPEFVLKNYLDVFFSRFIVNARS